MPRKITTELLRRLRKLMRDPSTNSAGEILNAYIVPSCDAHNSEYLASRDERRAFITGFTGSAGTAIVSSNPALGEQGMSALLWTDGRYYLQAVDQMDDNWTLMKEGLTGTPTRTEWLERNLEGGSVIGVDPFLISNSQFSTMKASLDKAGMRLVSVEKNLIDAIWGTDQPSYPDNPVQPLEIEFCGKSWEEKVIEVRVSMIKAKASVLVLSALDDVAWLLNLRGSDIKYNPVFFAYVAITVDKIHVFINESQVTDQIRKHLTADSTKYHVDNLAVEFLPYKAIEGFLERCSRSTPPLRVMLSNQASQALVSIVNSNLGPHNKFEGKLGDSNERNSQVAIKLRIANSRNKNGANYAEDENTTGSSDDNTMTSTANVNEENGKLSTPSSPIAQEAITDVSPVTLLKAIKNETEIRGFINCHIRDSAALCSYFAWLEKEVPKGTVTEVSGADKLLQFRQEMQNFVGPSFDTISSVGSNAAIIHYKPSAETDTPLSVDKIYLVDSGGQYKDGTTDVTRTVHFGTPSEFEKECFTRVFKGQTRLGRAIFPAKLKGNCLDSFARQSLWEVGLDYGHGTGHGVGSYLNVHEGPMGISWRPYPDDPGLQEGMILSNEPGYYMDDNFGIRIENLVRIVKAKTRYGPTHSPNKEFLTFENLTVVPIQVKMILPDLLSKEEVDYLNAYHELCRDRVGPLLREMGHIDGLNWLIRETEPIG